MARVSRSPDRSPDGGPEAAPASSRVFAFRADHEMVSMLAQMPNASEFIRRAIARSLEEPCPVCDGRGVVAPGFRAEMERLAAHFVLRRCDCCSAEYPAPCDTGGPSRLRGVDRLRQELLVARGEALCAICFEKAGTCKACGRSFAQHSPPEFVKHWTPNPCGRALITAPRKKKS